MKRLISSKEVLEAAKKHENLMIDDNTLVTAQARDLAKQHGVSLIAGPMVADAKPTVHPTSQKKPVYTEEDLKKILTAVLTKTLRPGSGLADTMAQIGHASEEDLGRVPVGVSGRHIHVTQEDLDALFGKGYQLTPIKQLSQPGQFAAKETVTLVGPKGSISKVRILGPVRPKTQVEILSADTFKLGVKAPIRLSGHLEGTPGVTVIGPAGTLVVPEGVIIAARHLHMTPDEASERGLHDGEVISLIVDGERGGRLDNVVVRCTPGNALDCHIDTEEANALHITNGAQARIVRGSRA